MSKPTTLERRLEALESRLKQRLEAARQKQVNAVERSALVEILPFGYVGERHLVMTSSPDVGPCLFQEKPGPGQQLTDFGEFTYVLRLTAHEMGF
jgi:hypothetical protein